MAKRIASSKGRKLPLNQMHARAEIRTETKGMQTKPGNEVDVGVDVADNVGNDEELTANVGDGEVVGIK